MRIVIDGSKREGVGEPRAAMAMRARRASLADPRRGLRTVIGLRHNARHCQALVFPDRFMRPGSTFPFSCLCVSSSVFLLALALARCGATRPEHAAKDDRSAVIADGARAELAILESTDIHSNIGSYDYYRLADDPSLGFERMATLVKQARAEVREHDAVRRRRHDPGHGARRLPGARRSRSAATRSSRSTAPWMRSATTAARSATTSSTTACRFSRR